MYDDVIECPFCQHKDSIENFLTLEQDGQRGLEGKTAERFIMLLCPQCKQEIKWDTLEDTFLKPDQKAKSGSFFFLIYFVLIALIIYCVIRFII